MISFRHILLALAVLISGTAFSQSLNFSEMTFDFGTIEEDGGKVSHTFGFSNVSEKPVVVLSSSSSCGCTTASFSRKPVAPGQSGEVTVVFDPKNYPGIVSRSVILHTSDASDVIRLTITGRVRPHRKSTEEQYPLLLGDSLRMNLNAHAFGYVEHGRRSQSAFELINLSAADVRIELKPRQSSAYLDLSYPRTVPSHGEASINFAYDLKEDCAVYGSLFDSFDIFVNGKKSLYPASVSGVAVDCRDRISDTEEPRISLSENFVNFGNIGISSFSKSKRLWIKNEGSGPLHLRRMEFERNRYLTEGDVNATLKPGGKVGIDIYPNRDSMSFGSFNDRLRIISDDPKNPMKSVRVSSIIEQR